MRYSITQFLAEHPDDNACLRILFTERYGHIKICPLCKRDTRFYFVKGRKCFACMHCGHQVHPLADTIFHKSSTSLVKWFYAMYLFSVSKNGIAATELARQLGVTYKTAHRMARQIRSLMADDSPIGGVGTIVEADETYYGGKQRRYKHIHKIPILGIVERSGRVRAVVSDAAGVRRIRKFFYRSLVVGTELYTDESRLYIWTREHYIHESINHSKKEYARGRVHTNTIEGFWSQLKRSLSGTYHWVSAQHLQSYVDEFAFRYSHRGELVYPLLVKLAAQPVE